MAEVHRRGPDHRLTALITGAAVLGAALVLAREAVHGVQLDGNSLYYAVAAHGLLEGRGLTTFEGAPFAGWPPVYPVLLAVAAAVAPALWLAANAERSLSGLLLGSPEKRSLSYGGLPWAGSETLRYLRGNPVDGRVYSNEPGVVLLHNDGAGTYRQMYLFKRPPPETVLSDGATVVWLRKSWSGGPGAGHLLASPMYTPLAELADGLISRVDNRPPFDVELAGKTLAWRKAPCTPADVRPRFFLHVFPEDTADLPIHRRRYSFRHGFDNRDFRFEDFGMRFDGRWGRTCLALVRLPDYAIASLRTGQFDSGSGPLWKIEIERP